MERSTKDLKDRIREYAWIVVTDAISFLSLEDYSFEFLPSIHGFTNPAFTRTFFFFFFN